MDHREDLVAERTRIQNRLRWHLHELFAGLEIKPRTLRRLHVLEGVEKLREGLGLEHVLLEVEFPGMGRRRVLEQVERLGNRVVPYLNRAAVTA